MKNIKIDIDFTNVLTSEIIDAFVELNEKINELSWNSSKKRVKQLDARKEILTNELDKRLVKLEKEAVSTFLDESNFSPEEWLCKSDAYDYHKINYCLEYSEYNPDEKNE